MTPLAFLNAVLPDAGSYCVAGIRNEKIEQLFVPSQQAILDAAASLEPGVNAFFACSSYDPEGARTEYGELKRTTDNVLLSKAFWMDMDVGVGTTAMPKYPDQASALLALREFCKELNLPRPIIVNSGYGVHVYWVLTEAIEYATWKPVANKLKAVCRAMKLHIDRKCTADAARILRVPGTFNYKDLNNPKGTNLKDPRPVEILMPKYKAVSVLEFAELLGAVDTPTVVDGVPNALPFEKPEFVKGTDDTTKNIAGENLPSSFHVVVSSRKCAQINHIVDNQAEIHEPLWRAGLSIAQACEDRDEAIHMMSREHPNYSEADTEAKAQGTAGPYHCTSFEDEYPDGCEGCPLKGKITSPIQLGRVIQVEDEAKEVVETDAKTGEAHQYTIPAYPRPYVRSSKGELVLVDQSKPEGQHEEIIYSYPIYVVKRMHDPELGECVLMRVHLPQDGVREFPMPLKDVGAKDRFRDAMLAQGVAVGADRLGKLSGYVMRWTQELQRMQKTEVIRSQNGWTEDETFVIGDREIREDGVFYSPPAASTLNVCSMLVKKGTVEGWKALADYHDAEGLEARAFAIFLGFGAPLLRFTNVSGGVVNLTSKESGVGKTTLQHIVNAIWGHPKQLLLSRDDTPNSRVHRMGVLNSIPVTVDEVTNITPGDLSDFLYGATAGRGKNRMNASSNTERINNTTWCTIALLSSNSMLADKIKALKATPEGELMRLLEIRLEPQYRHSKEVTDDLFATVGDHYGVVGEIYMQYIVNHRAEVQKLLREMQTAIDKNASLTQRERVWSSMAAAAITGGIIAQKLGLHSINVERVIKWLVAYLNVQRGDITTGSKDSGISSLGTYLDTHRRNTLVLNDKSVNGMPSMPKYDGESAIYVRVELDTKCVFVASNHFRKWCAENQISVTDILQELTEHGVKHELLRKRMTAGTQHASTNVNAYKFFDPSGKVLSNEGTDDKPNLSVVRRATP